MPRHTRLENRSPRRSTGGVWFATGIFNSVAVDGDAIAPKRIVPPGPQRPTMSALAEQDKLTSWL
ncbi:MAG: hypothetical protein U1F68_08010 [Gammaproteobacteria bacterium]